MKRTRNGATSTMAVVSIAIVIAIIASFALYYNTYKGAGAEASTKSSSNSAFIIGSGSSFIAPQMQQWITLFTDQNPNIHVEYDSVGSGAGVAQFLEGVTSFAGTDPPLPKDKWEANQGKVVQMPVILGAVVISYNIPNLNKPLNLTGEIIAQIYKGEITYWDDQKIAEINPAVSLPHKPIIAIHRSDSSGTTNVFTLFLHKSAPTIWPVELVGKTIEWPVDAKGNGVGGKGNEGVTSILKSTPYSIGYIELSYALTQNLPYAKIQNKAGKFVSPTSEAIQAAAKGALSALPDSPAGDFSNALNAIIYSDNPNAYPITSFSFLVFWTKYPASKADAVEAFIKFINTEGQQHIIKGYVRIPDEIVQLNLKALDLIKSS
ncbi:MAG: phosphate ABC transporter substrate-binding protein PstS [Desulfurococcales archaeon]|nr:phosphate ABC transporter substrate-binding protein PstS [Desulfurococcales archaeon]